MKFSVWPNMRHAPSEVLDLASWLDANGWYGLWYADHYMTNTGDASIVPGDAHECWAVLPAVAAVTRRIRVGSLVAPTSVHHPAVLANRAATIDHISNGRMVLGLGAGWQINEHVAYGIELEPPGRRVDRFEEAIQIVRSLLANERTTFDGEIYRITDAPADPKPVQSPLPILVGTGGPRMLRIAARHADEWNTWGGPAMITGRHAAFVAACESVGRDPASMWVSAQALLFVTDDQAVVDGVATGPLAERSIAGSVDFLVETLAGYAELGIDELIVPDFNLGGSSDARRDALERLRTEVFAQL